MPIPLIIAAVGLALSAYGTYASGKARGEDLDANAKLAEDQALIAEMTAVMEERQTMEAIEHKGGMTQEDVAFKTSQILEELGFGQTEIGEDVLFGVGEISEATAFRTQQLLEAAGLSMEMIRDDVLLQTGLIAQKTGIEERRERRKGERAMGTLFSRIGVSGLTMETFLPVIADTKRELELDALMIRYGGAENILKMIFQGAQDIKAVGAEAERLVGAAQFAGGAAIKEAIFEGTQDIERLREKAGLGIAKVRHVGEQQISDTVFTGEQAIEVSRFKGVTRAQNVRSGAEILGTAANAQQTATIMNTASTLLTEGSKIYSTYRKPAPVATDDLSLRLRSNMGGGMMIP